MIKAIFFDSGNVLVREGYTPGIAEYEKKHKIKKGKLYASAHDRPYWKDFTLGNITEEQYFTSLENDFADKLDIIELKITIYNNFIPNIELLNFIKILSSRFVLGVISNNPKEWFEYCQRKFGWDKLFTINTVSSYLHIRKPDERIFKQALDMAKVKGNESIYVDDRPDRVEGAENVGMNIIIYKDVEKLKKDFNILINFND